MLKLGVIEESRATHWSQVHPVLKSPGKWRLTLDFVRLNAATGGLEGWPIPNIQQTLSRLGTMKPTVFGLLDFTAGYHQTPLDKASRHLTAFMAMGGLYQWCDTTVHTVHTYALYVLYCLTLMYCTYYTYCILYVLCTFPVSHVEASSSTSVHTCSRT